MQPVSKNSLSPGRRYLVDAILAINHGRIEGVEVRNGEPVLSTKPLCIRRAVFGKSNDAHKVASIEEFVLNKQFVWLLELLGTRSLTINAITVNDGLPIHVDYTVLGDD